MNAKQILAQHPAPWSHVVHPNGLIQVLDGAGQEVPLLDMVGFVTSITAGVAAAAAKSAAAAPL